MGSGLPATAREAPQASPLPPKQTNKLSNQPQNHVTTQETFWGLKMFWGKSWPWKIVREEVLTRGVRWASTWRSFGAEVYNTGKIDLPTTGKGVAHNRKSHLGQKPTIGRKDPLRADLKKIACSHITTWEWSSQAIQYPREINNTETWAELEWRENG